MAEVPPREKTTWCPPLGSPEVILTLYVKQVNQSCDWYMWLFISPKPIRGGMMKCLRVQRNTTDSLYKDPQSVLIVSGKREQVGTFDCSLKYKPPPPEGNHKMAISSETGDDADKHVNTVPTSCSGSKSLLDKINIPPACVGGAVWGRRLGGKLIPECNKLCTKWSWLLRSSSRFVGTFTVCTRQ